MFSKFVKNTLYYTAFLAFLPLPAYAYLDPGTGSIMLQMLIGGIAGGLFLIKIYYQQLKDRFRAVFGAKKDEVGADKTDTSEN